MNNDNEKFDEIIRSAAQDYNRPPNTVPRDEMWTAIEAARTERARRPLHIVPPTPQPRFTRYTWMGLAAAAVLFIATGVGIGRWSNSDSAPSAIKAPRMASETQKPPTMLPPGGEDVKPAEAPDGSSRVATAEPDVNTGSRSPSGGSREAARGTPNSMRGTPGPRQLATQSTQRPLVPGGREAAPNSALSYQVATIHHLSNAEALLTAFRSDSRDAKMDAQLSIWARDLLSNTRLLLDSPAADDPQRAKLLGDLELVLAEMVQLAPNASAQDRELIEGSIKNGHVMTRLRSAIPAGQTRGL